MVKSKPKTKTLSFTLTPKQYGLFWEIVGILGEEKKLPAFLKMLEVIKEMYT